MKKTSKPKAVAKSRGGSEKAKKRTKKLTSRIDPRAEVKSQLRGAKLPGFSDFQSELGRLQKCGSMVDFDLDFWTRHFDGLLTESLSAVSSCLDFNVSQAGLLKEAEEMLREPFIESDFFNPLPHALTSLRDSAIAILIFLRRVALRPSGAAYQKEVSKMALDAMTLIEKCYTRPKGRVARKTQRKRKRGNAPTRKYSSEFQAKCVDLMKAALWERRDYICDHMRDGEWVSEPTEPFTPKCFQRPMPLSVFGFCIKDLPEWSKWFIDMLVHRARKGDLCPMMLRKRKSDIRKIWIPSLWDNALNF